MAHARFDLDLSEAELKVLHDSASSVDPKLTSEPAPRPEIRPDFVRWLATDREAALKIDPNGLRIWGITLPGKLDLAGCVVLPKLYMRRCTFSDEIDLESAEARSIHIHVSDLRRGIRANGITLRSDFYLRRVNCEGSARMIGARIGGDLNCSATKFASKDDALWLDQASIGGDADFSNGLECSTEVRLLGARIKGQLICSGAKLLGVGAALTLDEAEVGGSIFLDTGFESRGEISLFGVKVGGSLDCSGSKLLAKRDALSLGGATISGDIYLSEGFESSGSITLIGARVKGDLVCSKAKLAAPEDSLLLSRADVDGSVFLDDDFKAAGEINLRGARIGGSFECNGAQLSAADAALVLDMTSVNGDVFLKDDFKCSGKIVLGGARIGGNLECTGADLTAQGDALILNGARVGGDVFLNGTFKCSGRIELDGARIGGNLECTGAKLTGSGEALSLRGANVEGDIILDDGFGSVGEIRLPGARIGGDLAILGANISSITCTNMHVIGDLIWQGIDGRSVANLDLMGAKVRNLRDDQKSWPPKESLDLDGLEYEELTLHKEPTKEQIDSGKYGDELPLAARERIEWIMLQKTERRNEPQPWMKFRELLERKGDRKGAKYVLCRFRRVQAQKSRFLIRWWKILFAWLEENPSSRLAVQRHNPSDRDTRIRGGES